MPKKPQAEKALKTPAKKNRQAIRKEKTRALLVETTTKLLLEKGVDALTVHDITEGADVARGTFYVYFESKEAAIWSLLEAILKPIDQELLENPALDDASRMKKWLYIFQEISEHQHLLKVLLGEKGHISMLRRMEAYIRDLMERDFKVGNLLPKDGLDPDFVAKYLAGALMSVIVDWLEHTKDTTIDQVAQQFFTMARKQFEADTKKL